VTLGPDSTLALTLFVTLLATLVAGAVGAVVRAAFTARAPRLGTAAANVIGTALLALVLVALERGAIAAEAAVVLGVGLSGSLTTFSGWIALLADGLQDRPVRTLLVDLLLPLLVAVGVTVLAFAVVVVPR
jgi:fluoride ion exporter CrcB/FEX